MNETTLRKQGGFLFSVENTVGEGLVPSPTVMIPRRFLQEILHLGVDIHFQYDIILLHHTSTLKR